MSIKLNAECLACHFQRSVDTARRLGDEDTATAFARELLTMYQTTPEQISSPELIPLTNTLLQKYYHIDADRYREEKKASNRFALERMDALRSRALQSPDPVYAGLQLAILGNYIDFSALRDQVSFDTLEKLLEQAGEITLDEPVYRSFCQDLSQGKTLLYLSDNAGEIVFDRIAAELIHRAYPHLDITFCVRGFPAANDATREDAAAVGIPFPVIDNGNNVGGTVPALLSEEARCAMDRADVILSKGQGNIETLYGCKHNIYYAFLIKCSRFVTLFQKPLLTPMFLREPNR